jgi:hypothetical protein
MSKEDLDKLSYNVPTLGVLNPELQEKQTQVLNNPDFETIKRIKERYSYRDSRQQRVQLRQEEMSKQIKATHEET